MRKKRVLRMTAAAIAAAAALLPCGEAQASEYRLRETRTMACACCCADMEEAWRLAKKAFRENGQLAFTAKAARNALGTILNEALSCQKAGMAPTSKKQQEDKPSKEANYYKDGAKTNILETAAEITYSKEACSPSAWAESRPSPEGKDAAEEDEAVSAIVSSGIAEESKGNSEELNSAEEEDNTQNGTHETPCNEQELRDDFIHDNTPETIPEPSCEGVGHQINESADTVIHAGEGDAEKSHDDHYQDLSENHHQAGKTENEGYGDVEECGQYGQDDEPDKETKIEHSTDVSFGRSEADITYRDDGELKPAMVFVHGGSWTGGDKSSFSKFAEDFAKEGYAVISINYQLYDWKKMNLSEMRDDVEEAIKWASSGEAMEYQADPERVFVTGFSAGAHQGGRPDGPRSRRPRWRLRRRSVLRGA